MFLTEEQLANPTSFGQCDTPGMRIGSRGYGRGLARARGIGPMQGLAGERAISPTSLPKLPTGMIWQQVPGTMQTVGRSMPTYEWIAVKDPNYKGEVSLVELQKAAAAAEAAKTALPPVAVGKPWYTKPVVIGGIAGGVALVGLLIWKFTR